MNIFDLCQRELHLSDEWGEQGQRSVALPIAASLIENRHRLLLEGI